MGKRGSADPDYRGTRHNLHHEQQRGSGQSARDEAAACTHPGVHSASAALLIASAWPGTEEADWLDLQLVACSYTDKTPPEIILKGERKC